MAIRSSAGLPIDRLVVRTADGGERRLGLRDGRLERRVLADVDHDALLVAPGHVPLRVGALAATDEAILEPDVLVRIDLSGGRVDSVTFGPWTARADTSSARTVSGAWVCAVTAPADEAGAGASWVATLSLEDGRVVGVFVNLRADERASATLPPAAAAASLRASVTRSAACASAATTSAPLRVRLVSLETEPVRIEGAWGRVFVHAIGSREQALDGAAESVEFTAPVGALLRLEAETDDGGWFAGTGPFVHDGVPRTLVLHSATRVRGRLVLPTGAPIVAPGELRWTEGRQGDEARGGVERLSPLADGSFDVRLAPRVDRAVALGPLDIEFVVPTFAAVRRVATDCDADLGDVVLTNRPSTVLIVRGTSGDGLRGEDGRPAAVEAAVDGERVGFEARARDTAEGLLLEVVVGEDEAARRVLEATEALLVTFAGDASRDDVTIFARRIAGPAFAFVPSVKRSISQEDVAGATALRWSWPGRDGAFGGFLAADGARGGTIEFVGPHDEVWLWCEGEAGRSFARRLEARPDDDR